jgi:hypothetical protein
VVSGLLFGASHVVDAPWRDVVFLQTLMVFTGVGLALIYERRANLVADVAAPRRVQRDRHRDHLQLAVTAPYPVTSRPRGADVPTFPTDGWFQDFIELINGSAEYRAAAADWEGDIAFLVQAEPDIRVPDDVWGYLDLWHGACRGGGVVDAGTAGGPRTCSAPRTRDGRTSCSESSTRSRG